jgi:dephospho-CoA kinase
MMIIGLAGATGTGKTTIADHLEQGGARRIDADRVVHEVLRTNGAVKRAIRARFGDEVFDEDEVDRRALAGIVFADRKALADLNAIVHPPVIEVMAERVEQFRSEGARLVVIDAALLLEVALPFTVDLAIGLRCSRDEQVRRLRAKGEAPEHVIRARLANQADIERSLDQADVIVDTEKPKAELLAEIDRIILLLTGERS